MCCVSFVHSLVMCLLCITYPTKLQFSFDCFFFSLSEVRSLLNTHTPRKHPHAPNSHTAHAQKEPTQFMGRYHYPLPETAAVQSVGLPWLGSGRRASSRACENSHGR